MSVKTTKETCNQDITFKRNAYVEGSFIVPTFYDIYAKIDDEPYSLGDYLDGMANPKLPFSIYDAEKGHETYSFYSEWDQATENENYAFEIPLSLILTETVAYSTKLVDFTDPNDTLGEADSSAAVSYIIPYNYLTIQGLKKDNGAYKAISLALGPAHNYVIDEINNKICELQDVAEIKSLSVSKGSTNVFTCTGKWYNMPSITDNSLNTLIIMATNGTITYQASVNMPIKYTLKRIEGSTSGQLASYKPGIAIVPMAYGSTSDDVGNVRVEFTYYNKDTDYIKIDLDQCAFASDFQFKFYLKG